MKRFLLFLMCVLCVSHAFASEALTLVENGQPRAVIVVEPANNDFAVLAAEEFQRHIERSSGARLPIIDSTEAEKRPADTARVAIGFGPLAEKHGIKPGKLAPGEYVLKTAGNCFLLAGRDTGEYNRNRPLARSASAATLFAVSHWLDRELGARWLWPGELGAYIPKRATITVEPLDTRVKPPLLEALFSVALRSSKKYMTSTLPPEVLARMEEETMRWWGLHQLGGNSPLRFGHSFMHWWEDYHAAHPDYFATPPDGEKQMPPDRVKLCTSNPAVIGQVIAEWKAAGAPDSWNIGPNDGRGFCACDRCRALDEGGPHSAEAVWGGDVDLSRRHILFANELLRRMKAANPRATLCTYAYSAYRNVPRGVPLESGLAIQFVGSYTARDMWTAWADAGAKIGLRPNWLHSGAVAPFLPLHTMGGFMEFARNNGMNQCYFDSLMGYWATQGPNYYLIARRVARPELSVDDIIAEWCSAFGAAAPAVKDYIAYWEKFTEETGYMLACGGSVSTTPDSRYERLCSKYDIPSHPLVGSWRTLPLLYNDNVLANAETILAEADRLAGGADPQVSARILFLRDGLIHLRLTRDLIALVYAPKPDQREVAHQTEVVLALRDEFSPRHVVWGDVATGAMAQRGIKPFAASKVTKQDLKGL